MGSAATAVLGLLLLAACDRSFTQQCAPGCNCDERVAVCRGLTTLPQAAEFPTVIEMFEFIDCNFGVLTPLPYVNATTVMIINSQVDDVVDHAFSNLTALQHLEIINNPLHDIRPAMFDGLVNLIELSLQNSSLTSFPSGILSSLPSLNLLDVSHNVEIVFADDAFDSATVKTFILNHCALVEAPPLTRANPMSVTRLEMTGSNMDLLGDASFVQYSNLNRLHLEASQIQSIHVNAFQGLHQLMYLNLDKNNISHLTDDVFKANTEIVRLHLKQNNLMTLEVSLLSLVFRTFLYLFV